MTQSSMEVQKVKRVEFGLLNPDEIVSHPLTYQQNISVCEVFMDRIYSDD